MTRNPASSAALVAVLVATGSGISVPKPRAGIAPDSLLRAIRVKRRLSLPAIVSLLVFSEFEPVRSNRSVLWRLGTEPAFCGHWRLLGRLEDERVPTGDGDRHHPQRNQRREIERRNADH